MTLDQLIAALEAAPLYLRVPLGFSSPHSYRGYYTDLAFEPQEDTTVGQMLVCAKSALGQTYHGWKGGEYTMEEHTDVWLAEYGCSGETIGPVLLGYMLGRYK